VSGAEIAHSLALCLRACEESDRQVGESELESEERDRRLLGERVIVVPVRPQCGGRVNGLTG
jgi:hypothetical protein